MTKIERLRKNFASGMSEARISDSDWEDEFLPMLEDAERFNYMKTQYSGIDFAYGESRDTVLLIGHPPSVFANRSLAETIDAARNNTTEESA